MTGEETRSQETHLTLWERILLRLRGRVYLRHEQRSGWEGPLPIYAFRCPLHGVVEDYPHGFYDRLDCPYCSYSEEAGRIEV